MAENAKDSDERELRGGRGCAPVRLVDQERRAELDRQRNGLSVNLRSPLPSSDPGRDRSL